eukprot:18520-Heterococcus_DN1.PRE.2
MMNCTYTCTDSTQVLLLLYVTATFAVRATQLSLALLCFSCSIDAATHFMLESATVQCAVTQCSAAGAKTPNRLSARNCKR